MDLACTVKVSLGQGVGVTVSWRGRCKDVVLDIAETLILMSLRKILGDGVEHDLGEEVELGRLHTLE